MVVDRQGSELPGRCFGGSCKLHEQINRIQYEKVHCPDQFTFNAVTSKVRIYLGSFSRGESFILYCSRRLQLSIGLA